MLARRGAAAVAALAVGVTLAGPPAQAAPGDGRTHLYLVTLTGPGAAGHQGPLTAPQFRDAERARQDAVLRSVDAPAPVYRWLTALDGVAVRLTDAQARELALEPRVVSVERNAVRRMAGLARTRAVGTVPPAASRGGAGVVIGMVDSGLWPDSPVFADVPGLGRSPERFRGPCATAPDWPASTCSRKVVGARWFVQGFGADRISAAASLSPRDDDGHGTLGASIAAGDADVSVRLPHEPARTYSGRAPQARIAVYKACWTAHDPSGDGCATADLVTAIDRAARDKVDVLNLAVDGPDRLDTVERALLGATESGAVVVTAAGNRGDRAFAAHPSPWSLTVGATTGAVSRGVVGTDGLRLEGAMAARRTVGPARAVLGADVAARGQARADAARCLPGSLDADQVSGRIVVCERGGTGRIDKSAAVRAADGVGMVLVNQHPGSLDADLHSVPTVHLGVRDGRALERRLAARPRTRLRLSPDGSFDAAPRVARWSGVGDPEGAVLKPDVVADGDGVLGATRPTVGGLRWDLATGTSAATATTAGEAAVLLGRGPAWTPARVRSALVTSAVPVAGDALHAGAGRAPATTPRPAPLAYLVGPRDYRRWLGGDLAPDRLNVPSVLLDHTDALVTRRITNVGDRDLYFSSSAEGFAHHQVVVTPAAVRLRPGQSATFRIHVYGAHAPQRLDDGHVLWRGADGSTTSIPVVISR